LSPFIFINDKLGRLREAEAGRDRNLCVWLQKAFDSQDRLLN
jgi:hypothetical protein